MAMTPGPMGIVAVAVAVVPRAMMAPATVVLFGLLPPHVMGPLPVELLVAAARVLRGGVLAPVRRAALHVVPRPVGRRALPESRVLHRRVRQPPVLGRARVLGRRAGLPTVLRGEENKVS